MAGEDILHLQLFGFPQVEIAGKRGVFSTRKTVALLVYLVVTEQPHSRDALAALLWPESDQTRARGSLRHALADLRKAIGDEWLELEGDSIALENGDNRTVDVVQFRRALQQCQSHGHGTNELCPRCIEPLTEAVTLYKGDFLAGFSLSDSPGFDEWHFFQNERLRNEYVGALERLVELHVGQESWEAAIGHAQRWVAVDPLHEVAQRRVMEIYALAGQHSVALRHYELYRQILADEMGVAPSPETDALSVEIREHKRLRGNPKSLSVTSLATPRHNLPAPTTPFIGRAQEVSDLQRLLENKEIRLITILGPGGMGKTRLVLEVAACHLQNSQDRVAFVALAPVQVAEEMVTAIAHAMNYAFKQDGRSEKVQLLDYIGQKQMLLVLDNAEHLVEGMEFVNTILEAAPGVKVLATSRERLQLSSETVFVLGGMSFYGWQSLEDTLSSDTVQLFMQGARRSRADFELAAEDLAAVAHICRSVGGMPLGILLAAAWVDLLTPREIAQEIDRSLDLLTTTLRDVPERQRSLRALFDRTWQRLTEAERTSLMKLAYFRGGFTRDAAQIVADASLRSLSVLVDKSLVQREPQGRYTVHELLRQYAEAELQIAGQVERVANAHSVYYANFLAQREGDLKGQRQKAALEEIEADFANLRLGWEWASKSLLTDQLAQALESLGMVYEWSGRLQEGLRAFSLMVEGLTEKDADQLLLVRGLVWQAQFSHALGDNGQTTHLLAKSLMLIETPALATLDTRPHQAAILRELGGLAYEAADRQEASALFGRSLSLYRELGDRWQQAKVLLALEGVERNYHGYESAKEHQQQAEKAKELVLESLSIFRELGDDTNVSYCQLALGVIWLTLGEPARAQITLEDALILCHEYGSHNNNLAEIVGFLGVVAEFSGEYTQMQARGNELLTIANETNVWHAWRLGYLLTGGAALATHDFSQAEVYLSRAVATSRSGKRKGNLSFDLTGLALATYWQQKWTATLQLLHEAMQIAAEVRAIRAAGHGLLLAALLLADRGESALALELYSLAMTYPFVANSRWCHDAAGWRIAAIVETLPPAVVADAQQRGRLRNVWQATQEVLVRLR